MFRQALGTATAGQNRRRGRRPLVEAIQVADRWSRRSRSSCTSSAAPCAATPQP